MKWIVFVLVIISDMSAYFMVPHEVRTEYSWALVPGGGFCLFGAYHFGDKIKAPNS